MNKLSISVKSARDAEDAVEWMIYENLQAISRAKQTKLRDSTEAALSVTTVTESNGLALSSNHDNRGGHNCIWG